MKKSSLVIFTLCIVYLIESFYSLEVFQYILSFVAIVALFVGIAYASKLPRIVGLTILGISFVISLGSEMGLLTMVEGIRRNIAILVLILLAPFITIPLRLSGYLEKIVSLMTMLKSNLDRAFFSLLSILFVLAPILNVGAIRVTQELVKDIDFKPKFLTKAYVNGYLSAIVWSPYFATVAIVLYLFEVNLNSYILIGLTFGIIQIIIGYLLFHFHKGEAHEVVVRENTTEDMRSLYWMTGKLFLIILLGIGSLIYLEYISSFPMLLLVSLSAIVIPFVFGVSTGQMKQTLAEMKYHITNLNRSCNEIVLFLSAGILGSALENTAFSQALDTFFLMVASTSTLLFGITVIFIVILFTVIGIHQIIIVPLLITQVDPQLIGISPLALAFVFILAWCVSVALSPISATNLLISNMLKAKWWQVGFKWNGAYILMSVFVGLIFFVVIQLFGV